MPGAGNPQAWNRYSYTFNNPIKHIDPTGHDPWWCDGKPSCGQVPISPPTSTPTATPTSTPTATPTATPTSTPTATPTPVAPTGWWALFARIKGTRVGDELLAQVPDFWQGPYIGSDLFGAYAVPRPGILGMPATFNPDTASNEEIAAIAHELTHLVQRQVGRRGFESYGGTKYTEVEANIVRYAILFELSGPGSPEGNRAQVELGNYTGPLADAYQALDRSHWSYALYPRGTHGSGNWRSTLPGLGFSPATVQFIDSIP